MAIKNQNIKRGIALVALVAALAGCGVTVQSCSKSKGFSSKSNSVSINVNSLTEIKNCNKIMIETVKSLISSGEELYVMPEVIDLGNERQGLIVPKGYVLHHVDTDKEVMGMVSIEEKTDSSVIYGGAIGKEFEGYIAIKEELKELILYSLNLKQTIREGGLRGELWYEPEIVEFNGQLGVKVPAGYSSYEEPALGMISILGSSDGYTIESYTYGYNGETLNRDGVIVVDESTVILFKVQEQITNGIGEFYVEQNDKLHSNR